MKRLLLIIVIAAVAFGAYWYLKKDKTSRSGNEKLVAIVTRKHSAQFNSGIDSMLNAYFNLKEAFVNADSVMAKTAAARLALLADSSRVAELKNDNAGIYESAVMQVSDVKANAESLGKQTDFTEMKQDFRMVGESIYPLLKTIHYDGNTLYWQNCPMAFGEDKGANWISSTKEIVNPYLGKHHPEYKSSMLHCGEVKDSIKAE
jgi:hypothetical protein